MSKKIDIKKIVTLGDLKKSGYKPKSIKDEVRDNLIASIQNKENAFEGILGYEDTVIPDVERALLSRHNILFLGLRGQAKTGWHVKWWTYSMSTSLPLPVLR